MIREGPRELQSAFRQFAGKEDGDLALETAPGFWPESFLMARDLAAKRMVLAGEAAHVLTPIGAQGLNLSLADAAALASLGERAVAEGLDPGSPALLAAYARHRRKDMVRTMSAVSAYGLVAGLPGEFPSRTRVAAAQCIRRSRALRSITLRTALGKPGVRAARDIGSGHVPYGGGGEAGTTGEDR